MLANSSMPCLTQSFVRVYTLFARIHNLSALSIRRQVTRSCPTFTGTWLLGKNDFLVNDFQLVSQQDFSHSLTSLGAKLYRSNVEQQILHFQYKIHYFNMHTTLETLLAQLHILSKRTTEYTSKSSLVGNIHPKCERPYRRMGIGPCTYY